MSFPVWRELKHRFRGYVKPFLNHSLAMSFPVWRELKRGVRIATPVNRFLACNVLSRLKGIETWPSPRVLSDLRFHLQCPFPFEGNRNCPSRLRKDCYWRKLAMSFPVWRELKPIIPFIILISPYPLAMSFPVWRELKLNYLLPPLITLLATCNVLSRLKGIETSFGTFITWYIKRLQCPFPFEGNWNCNRARVSVYFCASCNVLSRLKGIETDKGQQRNDRTNRFLQCPFPFEGNWNHAHPSEKDSIRSKQLAMSFPVWRELKRFNGYPTRASRPSLSLQCPFPFEGN